MRETIQVQIEFASNPMQTLVNLHLLQSSICQPNFNLTPNLNPRISKSTFKHLNSSLDKVVRH